MQVGLIGNMNGNLLSLTRYLRDNGVDAQLLSLNNEPSHFKPGAFYFDANMDAFCKEVEWGDFSTFTWRNTPKLKEMLRLDPGIKSKVQSDLSPFDVLIGCGAAPAFVNLADRNLSAFCPYGEDLYGSTKYRFKKFTSDTFFSRASIKYNLDHLAFVKCQRRGIKQSLNIFGNQFGMKEVALKLGFAGKYENDLLPLIYRPAFERYNFETLLKVDVAHRILNLKKDCSLLIVSATRHCWHSDHLNWYDKKGNDILLKGFASFALSDVGKRSALVLFEYGPDVAASKRLISELGIGNKVTWLPFSNPAEVGAIISLSDIVAGDFNVGWHFNSNIIMGLVSGKPVLQYRKCSNIPRYGAAYKYLHAQNEYQIFEQLSNAVVHDKEVRAIGAAGKRWYHEEVEGPVISKILEIVSKSSRVSLLGSSI